MPDLKKAVEKTVNSRSSTNSNNGQDGATSSDGDESLSKSLADRYMLKVTAGPDYDITGHRIVQVNGPDAVTIESKSMTVKLKVRIRGYNGLPKGSPTTSSYFSDPLHKNDQYSIAFSFIPKKNLPSEDLVWGNDFDHPIRDRLPPGSNTAIKIVKQFIDPGLECDAYADKPWLYGPALSCWFALRIGEKGENTNDTREEREDIIHEGADGSGKDIRAEHHIPETSEKRRKFFLDAKNRQRIEFEKDRVYRADFFNPYLDFSNFALKLPGFSLGVLKYIGDKTHTLRYVFKNPKTDDVFFVVVFTLLHGEDLQIALKEDQMGGSRQSQVETSPDDVD